MGKGAEVPGSGGGCPGAPLPSWWSPDKGQQVPGAGPFAMRWAIPSLAVPFLALVIAYACVRLPAQRWLPGPDVGLPWTIWVATALIVAASTAVEMALRAARRDRLHVLRGGLLAALLCGLGFVACQIHVWLAWLGPLLEAPGSLFGFTFVALTALHALHVGIGLVLLGAVTAAAVAGRYWSLHHPGPRYCAAYWHFLGGSWLFVLGALVLGTR